MQLITQGKASFDGNFYFDCPIRLTFNDAGFTIESEFENITCDGQKTWWRSKFIKVSLTRDEAFNQAKRSV